MLARLPSVACGVAVSANLASPASQAPLVRGLRLEQTDSIVERYFRQCSRARPTFQRQLRHSTVRTAASASPYEQLDRTGTGEAWDVLGLGQAMVDTSACVSDEFLDSVDVEKGCRRIIDVDERGRVLQRLEPNTYQVSAGGSLSNSLMALAKLGAAEHAMHGRGQIRVAMDGIIGSDMLSTFYHMQMKQAGVEVLASPAPQSCTGTVMVLTTPDANRTMLSYLGTPAPVVLDASLKAAIARARLLVIEGYVWEMPDAAASIAAAMATAHAHGTLVALTAGDAGCVSRNSDALWRALNSGVDLLFTNKSEASSLLGHTCSAQEAALSLGPHADMVVVTDGANGSCISALGELHVVPPCWSAEPPKDTCGAGDAYAAGVLWAYLRGQGVSAMGRAGAQVASHVINRQGATLTEEAADVLVHTFPASESNLTTLSSADMW